MTPDQHPIRGQVHLAATGSRWNWQVWGPAPRRHLLDMGHEPTLPAAYDRCAAAVTKAREEEGA